MVFNAWQQFVGLCVLLAGARADAQVAPTAAATTTLSPAQAEKAVQHEVSKDLEKAEEDAEEGERPLAKGVEDAWALARGESCRGSEVMWGPCPQLPACKSTRCDPIDCSMKAWSDWSSGDCTGLCERQRNVAEPNNQCGQPCRGALIETKNDSQCLTCGHPKKVDCEWGEWTAWSDCSCTCGGGQTMRHRDILVSPKAGGKLCKNLTREEIAPCSTRSCDRHCQDGEWGGWEDWSACSHSCGGGTRLRSRLIHVEADECGVPATGKSQEFEACNAHVSCEKDANCAFGDWTDWSACSCTCDGVMRRSRRIATYGRGDGRWCLGSTKEILACNPAPGDASPPKGCEVAEPVDCEMSGWQDWADCTATCGAGQRDRRREVTKEPKASGKPCAGPLMEIGGCGERPCGDEFPVDCEWGQWSDWGACDKCGGEKRRYRHIEQMPKSGGTACGYEPSEEFTACPRHCHERTYCSWRAWGEWDACTASCGSGTRMRERKLELTTKMPLQMEYEDLQVRTERAEAGRLQEALAAFAAGAVSFVFAMASARALRSRRAPGRAYGLVASGAEQPLQE